MTMTWKTIKAAAVAMAMTAGAASAATLASVTEADGPLASGQAILVVSGTVIQNIIGQPVIGIEPSDGAMSTPALFNSTVSAGEVPEITGFAIGPLSTNPVLLTGRVVDYAVTGGSARVLYGITGGAYYGAGWGDYAVLTVDAPDGNLSSFTLRAATDAAVPLPASALLLLSGTAGLALLRRRG